jgi:HAD superfamily hydrolase (TIGR01490 family)
MSPGEVVLVDLDGTITRRDTYLAYLIGFLARHPGRLPRAAPLPMAVVRHLAGQRDNTWLKTTFLRAVLGGLPRGMLESWTRTFLDRVLATGLRARALETIERHRAAGHRLVLVTASLDFYAEPLGARLGFDHVLCTRAAFDETGRLTGELDGRNCYGAMKLERVRDYLRAQGLDSPTVLYTDHHSDLPLLRGVDLPIAVNPTRRLRRIATRSGIRIDDWELPSGQASALAPPLARRSSPADRSG